MKRRGNMSKEEEIPAMQRLLDNPFLLLFIGVTFPTVFYIIWGIMEIIGIPAAPPMLP
jgi:hypothetical protein